MRIAIFTNNYLPNPYGVSMSIESFRREFERRGHSVYIFAPETKGYADKNQNVYRYPSVDFNYKISFPLAIPFSWRIDKILEKLDIDIIHAQHPNLLGSAARKWAKKKNVPLVFTWHTLYDKYAHFVPLIPASWAIKWTINNAVRYANRCDQVIVPTKSVEKIIHDWGVTNKNIVDIQSGVDEKEFENAAGDDVRQKYGIAENETVAFFIGRLTAEKNVDFLMQSMVLALKQMPSLKFLVSGGGDQIAAAQKIAEENGVAERVIFTGLVAQEERKNYFAAADIFVYASKSETQGMIITEAMYMGLPVVAVEATGAKDLVRNNETGILTQENEEEFSAAVAKLVNDKNLRQQFGDAAQKIAREKYTSSICANKLLAVYEKIINTFAK